MFAAKEETRRTKRPCTLFTGHHEQLKGFWRETGKCRHRKLISNNFHKRSGLIILTKYLIKCHSPVWECKQLWESWEQWGKLWRNSWYWYKWTRSEKGLKSGKAAGVDGVIAETLKAAEQEIAPFLTRYFNVLFSSPQFPSEWTKAVIIQFHCIKKRWRKQTR